MQTMEILNNFFSGINDVAIILITCVKSFPLISAIIILQIIIAIFTKKRKFQ